jgi:Uma2 family endonuclease
MTIANTGTLFTPDDLLRMENAVNYELVDGKLVERHLGMRSSQIAARVLALVSRFASENRLGLTFGADAGYQCYPDAPDRVRKPDVSFIRAGRLPGDEAPEGHCRIPPDLAVEVVSPNDLSYEVEEKVAEYLAAGVPLVWVVHPPTRTVRVHRPRSSPRGSVADLSGGDQITGEEALPGFTCRIDEFFAA